MNAEKNSENPQFATNDEQKKQSGIPPEQTTSMEHSPENILTEEQFENELYQKHLSDIYEEEIQMMERSYKKIRSGFKAIGISEEGMEGIVNNTLSQLKTSLGQVEHGPNMQERAENHIESWMRRLPHIMKEFIRLIEVEDFDSLVFLDINARAYALLIRRILKKLKNKCPEILFIKPDSRLNPQINQDLANNIEKRFKNYDKNKKIAIIDERAQSGTQLGKIKYMLRRIGFNNLTTIALGLDMPIDLKKLKKGKKENEIYSVYSNIDRIVDQYIPKALWSTKETTFKQGAIGVQEPEEKDKFGITRRDKTESQSVENLVKIFRENDLEIITDFMCKYLEKLKNYEIVRFVAPENKSNEKKENYYNLTVDQDLIKASEDCLCYLEDKDKGNGKPFYENYYTFYKLLFFIKNNKKEELCPKLLEFILKMKSKDEEFNDFLDNFRHLFYPVNFSIKFFDKANGKKPN